MCPSKASPNYYAGLEADSAKTSVGTRGNIRFLFATTYRLNDEI